MATSANAIKIYEYVKAHDGEKFTAEDISVALDIPKRSVDGVITMKFKNAGLMTRIPAELTLPDGTHKPVKLISLTPEGRKWVPEMPADED